MNPNIKMVQRQIRSFNKAFSRIQSANQLSGQALAIVSDLMDYERMTKSGFAKAGTRYLENMTEEELLSYSADIEDAYDIVRWDKEMSEFELSASDPESLLWKLFDLIEDKTNFDSDDVKDVIDGVYDVGYKEMASKMYRMFKDKQYGMSDFQSWFQTKRGLE